ncbi:MAG TPA: ABC transporter substrate-binding protein, partial [Armatimonadota bacterium]|nr:ABC transporter substrate-binding protein [Armatimonadota bacterium]
GGPSFAQEKIPLEKITFATDWKAQAEHGGFYQALAMGLYKKHGLDVTIRMGGPGSDTQQLLAAGAVDMALGSNQGNRIWSLRLLKAGSASWGSDAINSDRGCRNAEEPASVRSFARSKGSSASNRLPDFSYAIALSW